MSRLIDADAFLRKMNLAIVMMKHAMTDLDCEDDPELVMELKAYQDIRQGIKDEPTVELSFMKAVGAEVKLAATVECTGCGVRKRVIFKASEPTAYVPFFDFDNAFNDVISEWNRRASDENRKSTP